MKTADFFFENPSKKSGLLEISRSVRLAHTSAKKNLTELVKSKLVVESVDLKGKRKFRTYKANADSKRFRDRKMVYNVISLLDSGLIEFIEDKLSPKCIVLFGSYRRGEDVESSDIDVFVECKEERISVIKFRKKLNRIIQLHFKEDFNLYSAELKNNVINGFVLSGFLEGFK